MLVSFSGLKNEMVPDAKNDVGGLQCTFTFLINKRQDNGACLMPKIGVSL